MIYYVKNEFESCIERIKLKKKKNQNTRVIEN